jgi:hypothetical protein
LSGSERKQTEKKVDVSSAPKTHEAVFRPFFKRR